MTTLSLAHRTNKGAWISVGPFYDVPSETAKTLKPGATVNLVEEFSDPSLAILADAQPGKQRVFLALHGQNKLKIRYFSKASDWERWLEAEKTGRKRMNGESLPSLEVAYSAEFDIPITGK